MEQKHTEESLIYHKPVLVKEVLEYMSPQPGGLYIDATFGTGGHTRALLQAEPTCKVIAMDWDTTALEVYAQRMKEEFGDRLRTLWGNFAQLHRILKKEGIAKVDGILADFGTSQVQIMGRAGFSLYRDTPLDMRMSPAYYKVTAAHVVNKSSEEKLSEIFWQLGEERHARKIAQAIIEARRTKPFRTTTQLAQLIEKIIPVKRGTIHPATRVFQALRIYVNDELNNINAFLAAALAHLNSDARLVCISFHSLEDRIVKQFLQEKAEQGLVRVLTKKVVEASYEEVTQNPSSRSARLRAAQYLGLQ